MAQVGPPELSTPLAERRTSDASLPEPTSAVSSLANSPRALTPEATFLVDRPASHTAIGSVRKAKATLRRLGQQPVYDLTVLSVSCGSSCYCGSAEGSLTL